MRSGELRHFIQIHKLGSVTRDHRGEELKNWFVWANVHAAIYPYETKESQDEKFDVHAQHNLVTHKFVIRYLENLDINMRIVYRGVTYEIRKILNISMREKMTQLICIEKPND